MAKIYYEKDVKDDSLKDKTIAVLIPDEFHSEVFEKNIRDNLESGKMLIFAHGFSIHFSQVNPPEFVDVAMVAPKGPGHLVRSEFVLGRGVPALIALYQDYTKKAKNIAISNDDVIRPLNKPYNKQGGIVVLYGNLAENGAVAKLSGVPEKMLYHRGPAVVFNNEEDATRSILNGKIKKGNVVVIRYEGPKGGPGMREMLSATSAIIGMGLINDVALITDSRFSGGSKGAVIGHISPEAAEEGMIGIVKNGDTIEIDFYKRKLNLLIDESEAKRRFSRLRLQNHKEKTQVLQRYSYFVQSAYTGAIFKEID